MENQIKSIYPQHDLKNAQNFEYDSTFTRIKEHPGHSKTNKFNASYNPADSFLTDKNVAENREDNSGFDQLHDFKYERISSLNQVFIVIILLIKVKSWCCVRGIFNL